MSDKADNKNSTAPSAHFLRRGSEYLAAHPEFKLVGRKDDIKAVATALMRRDADNLVIHGQAGVGISSILLGLQASKDDASTPHDVVGKRLYWLDVDALFSSGDAGKINEAFNKTLAELTRYPDTVVVIDDTKGFMDGVRNNGVSNIVNALMREVRVNRSLQAVFEVRDEHIGELYKLHPDFHGTFARHEVSEPAGQELKDILLSSVRKLEEHHSVSISAEAIDRVLS